MTSHSRARRTATETTRPRRRRVGASKGDLHFPEEKATAATMAIATSAAGGPPTWACWTRITLYVGNTIGPRWITESECHPRRWQMGLSSSFLNQIFDVATPSVLQPTIHVSKYCKSADLRMLCLATILMRTPKAPKRNTSTGRG